MENVSFVTFKLQLTSPLTETLTGNTDNIDYVTAALM